MLRPRLVLASLLGNAHIRQLGAPTVARRSCTTLADIRAFVSAIRAQSGVSGGTAQLCITEDMEVYVSHSPSPPASSPRFSSLPTVWQGTAEASVRDALTALQPSLVASPPPRSAPTRQAGATLVDLHRVGLDEVRVLVRHVETMYPELQLVVRHTSGQDLQGTRLHTFQVELVPRDAAAELPAALQSLTASFTGESVGEGYNASLKRALRDAFAAANVPLPTASADGDVSLTVLSLYAQIWQQDGYQLSFTQSLLLPAGAVECAVRHRLSREPLATATLPLTAAGLAELLKFCDSVAAAHNAGRHRAAVQRLRDAPLHLLLPRSNLRVKALLRRLLFYHFGCHESDVDFSPTKKASGLVTVEVQVRLPALFVAHDTAASRPTFVVATATGSSLKRVAELAAVQAMQALFPDIFDAQIAYHPDVRGIQQRENATVGSCAPPHVSQGLEAQLRWAAQQVGADVVVESVPLKRNTPYPLWGITTTGAATWLSQVFTLRKTPPAGGGEAPTSEMVRELCAHAFDSRKSRSEQKAMAAAIAAIAPHFCRAAIQDAVSKSLIDASGAPSSYDGVQPIQAPDTERFAAALSDDPCLSRLSSSRSSTLQLLPPSAARHSALAHLWTRFVQRTTDGPARVQLQRDTANGQYVASCVTATEDAAAVPRVLREARGTTEIGALFALLAAAEGGAAEAEAEGTAVLDFLAGTPSVPPASTPLQTCVDAIARLYGLRCSVRVVMEDGQHAAELWGSFPVESALLRQYDSIRTSPFLLDRTFLLGRGHAESPFMAVVRAALNVFEMHVRGHLHAFPDTLVPKGRLYLHPAEGCALMRLCDAVLMEISASSASAVSGSDLTVSFERGQPLQLAFAVLSQQQSITLEEAVGRSFLRCASDLCARISAETGLPFQPASLLAPGAAQTPEQLLRQLCSIAYGVELVVDTLQVHTTWRCRLSIKMTEEVACCIAESSARRKRSAEDAAAKAVLTECFPEEVRHAPHLANVFAGRDAGGEEAAEEVSLENYFYLRADTSEGDGGLPKQ